MGWLTRLVWFGERSRSHARGLCAGIGERSLIWRFERDVLLLTPALRPGTMGDNARDNEGQRQSPRNRSRALSDRLSIPPGPHNLRLFGE